MPKKDAIAIPADPGDAEDFDVTPEALDAAHAARKLRRTRRALGMSQAQFAARFHIPLGTLRDWEQSRVRMPEFARAFVAVIAKHPEAVLDAVA